MSFFMNGKWKGEGKVLLTNKSVEYIEEMEITPFKDPVVYKYNQNTYRKSDNMTMHSECGFIRVFQDPQNLDQGQVEFLVTHPFGVAEIEQGTFSKNVLTLNSTSIQRSEKAKTPYVTSLIRQFKLENDVLSYTVQMGANNNDASSHLEASLKRI